MDAVAEGRDRIRISVEIDSSIVARLTQLSNG